MTSHPTSHFGLPILAFVLVLSCTQSPEMSDTQSSPSEVKVTYVDQIDLGGNALLVIEGMTCERMCVNAVTKSVAKVPSVEIGEMRFDVAESPDTLILKYDPAQVDEQTIIHAIESLVGGDTYHVKEIQLTKDSKTSRVLHFNPHVAKRAKEDVNSYRFQVPNFLEMLRRVSI